jgi:hypothetical protein
MRRIALTLTALVALFGGAAVSAPAEAKTYEWGQCSAEGLFCAWGIVDGWSLLFRAPNYPGAQSVHYLADWNRDRIVSYWNRGSQDAMLLDWNGRCYELLARIGPGGQGNLADWQRYRTDVIKFGYASSLPGAC